MLSQCHSWLHCTVDTRTDSHCLPLIKWQRFPDLNSQNLSLRIRAQQSYRTAIEPAPKLTHTCLFHSSAGVCTQTYVMPVHQNPQDLWPESLPNGLPAVACKTSRERKQQIKTVPFMMAARRTLIVTHTIYTKAGRLKGTQKEEAGHREGQLVEGLESVNPRCCRSHGMPKGLYVNKQLALLFRAVGARVSTSVLRPGSMFQCWITELLNDDCLTECFRLEMVIGFKRTF